MPMEFGEPLGPPAPERIPKAAQGLVAPKRKRNYRLEGPRRTKAGKLLGRPPVHDWPKIELAYLHGIPTSDGQVMHPSLQQICDRFGCGIRQAENHSARGRWSERREAYQRKGALAEIRLRHARMLRKAVIFDDKSLRVAERAIDEADNVLTALAEVNPMLVDVLAFERLVSTMAVAHRMGRLALSLPTELLGDGDERQRRAADEAVVAGLSAEQMADIKALEEQVASGKIALVQLYQGIDGIFRSAREADAKRA
jgi:hypothetical protein